VGIGEYGNVLIGRVTDKVCCPALHKGAGDLWGRREVRYKRLRVPGGANSFQKRRPGPV
jgi:hypothetical protein